MSIFDKKSEITRTEFREILRKAPPYIPDSGGVIYSRHEREKLEKELFPSSRFSSHISSAECKRRLRELREESFNAGSEEKKIEIDRKVRFLQQVTGIKPY